MMRVKILTNAIVINKQRQKAGAVVDLPDTVNVDVLIAAGHAEHVADPKEDKPAKDAKPKDAG